MESLAPFTPTDEERQHPLAQEYLKSAGDLATANLQPTRAIGARATTGHGASGSTWGKREVNAVRAIPLIELDPRRIVPARFFPDDNNDAFVSLRRSLRAASIDDLKEFRSERFHLNFYKPMFLRLSDLMTTQTSEESFNRTHRRKFSDSSAESDISTSSNEGKHESVSTACLLAFIEGTLDGMAPYKYFVTKGETGPHFKSFADMTRFKWMMAEVKHVAENDGCIGVNSAGGFSGSDKNTNAPVVNIECKQRNAGGIVRGSGEPETFSPEVFGQEVAEMIGSRIAQEVLLVKYRDQETFLLGMHGTLFYASASYFSPEYTEYIKTAQHPATDTFLWVRRSVHFDLKEVDQRVKALEVLWALVCYLASGNAKVNIVAAALDAASG
ncbi:hypothetical protein FQN50_000618 [Emmonsiellopsis sp. PD_5]|nr:hypothetical protein FQN50_000618 [Emmonsiellopsis sp. PD_5]